MKPVLFVTGHVPVDRQGALRELHARVGIELALFGGRHTHGAPAAGPPAGVPHRAVSQHEVARLVAGGGYRAVIAGTGGRVALPAAFAAARARGVPFIFWAALWRTPRTPAHLAAAPLMLAIYREAAAVVTYGEHVSGYVAARGARRVVIAPQSVENAFWSAGAPAERRAGALRAIFVGRPTPAKGLPVLAAAWRISGLAAEGARLTVVAPGSLDAVDPGVSASLDAVDPGVSASLDAVDPGLSASLDAVDPGVSASLDAVDPGVSAVGRVEREALRALYAAADVLVVPSIRTRGFLEPWGLVVNEAMNQATAVIATDAVGAAAGGLVRDGRNGLVTAAGDPDALADALRRLAADPAWCARLGQAGARDVRAFTHAAWADGFTAALAMAGVGG